MQGSKINGAGRLFACRGITFRCCQLYLNLLYRSLYAFGPNALNVIFMYSAKVASFPEKVCNEQNKYWRPKRFSWALYYFFLMTGRKVFQFCHLKNALKYLGKNRLLIIHIFYLLRPVNVLRPIRLNSNSNSIGLNYRNSLCADFVQNSQYLPQILEKIGFSFPGSCTR